jgi:hypothetical protein
MNEMLENLRAERDILGQKVEEQSQQVLPFLVELDHVAKELRRVALACHAYEGNPRKDYYLDDTIHCLRTLIHSAAFATALGTELPFFDAATPATPAHKR